MEEGEYINLEIVSLLCGTAFISHSEMLLYNELQIIQKPKRALIMLQCAFQAAVAQGNCEAE